MGLLHGSARQELLQGSEIPPRAVIDLLENGQMEAGARVFYETVVRAGTWEERPQEVRQRWIFNADVS